MAFKCNQIDIYGNVLTDFDEKFIAINKLYEELIKDTGNIKKNVSPKCIKYEIGDKRFVFFVKQITYLGYSSTEDRSFKKRIQIPGNWKQNTIEFEKLGYDVRWLGVYSYKGNTLITDFNKEKYMTKKLNNSSAHVYTNDFYQAMNSFKFQREDKNGNKITTIRMRNFVKYLNNTGENYSSQQELLDVIDNINSNFPFDERLFGHDCMWEMYNSDYINSTQTKWNGFYLEFLYQKFLKENHIDNRVLRFNVDGKKKFGIDLDLYSEKLDLYSDLKASNIKKVDTPANDQEAVTKVLEIHGKLWYIIYQHDSIYDKEYSYKTFNEWEKIRKLKMQHSYKPSSGKGKNIMVGSIEFKNMLILEINKANSREILKEFNQGRNSNGKVRKPKFIINKKNIENFIIYRY